MDKNKSLLDSQLQLHDRDHHNDEVNHTSQRLLHLKPESYPGGIAIWGALPAVFNSSACIDDDNGVHVHARMEVGGTKQIDETFDVVRVQVTQQNGADINFEIDGIAAANYNISTVLKKKLKYLFCPTCKNVHTDTGILAVSYHTIHTCEHCGNLFMDSEPGISNAIMLLKEICGDILQDRIVINPVDRSINVKKNTFKGGMQMWGSNPAVLWTSSKHEEGGIHFHGFQANKLEPTVDETFGTLIIQDVKLDPEMVRHLMVQNALPYLKKYLQTLDCPYCKAPHFDAFDNAINPHLLHNCDACGCVFYAPNQEPCVSNPLINILNKF